MAKFWGRFGVLLLLLRATSLAAAAPDWESTVTAGSPGTFPPPRPLTAQYNFGWAGFTAATAEVHFGRTGRDEFELDGTGHTIGLVRVLWPMEVTHHAVADADRLRPLTMKQVETVRSKRIVSDLHFSTAGVVRLRSDNKQKKPPKPRTFLCPNLFDLHSSLLYLRSQPLATGSVYRIVVYPASSPYLATLTVLGREKISVRAGRFDAIKLGLQLKKIGEHRELEPHRKFRRATIWISDDGDRLPLRIEAQIFVGTVFAELRSVNFPQPAK
jgi:Protein of unknown function (DUF3108)